MSGMNRRFRSKVERFISLKQKMADLPKKEQLYEKVIEVFCYHIIDFGHECSRLRSTLKRRLEY